MAMPPLRLVQIGLRSVIGWGLKHIRCAGRGTLKTLIVDDHALFRAGLRLLLKSMNPQVEVLEAGTLAEAFAAARRHPDLQLCLLDLSLQGESGLDALTRFKVAAPDLAIVVVSAATDASTVHACLDAGAMSFVPKSVSPQELVIALCKVMGGDVYLPEDVLLAVPPGEQAPQLSPRQFDTLRALARGLSAKSIARELDLSEHTVKEYTGAVFQALGVHNRTEAVVKASRLGLLGALQNKPGL